MHPIMAGSMTVIVLCTLVYVSATAPPISVTPPTSVGLSTLARTTGVPTELWGAASRPKPTNAWWENMVLGSGTEVANAVFTVPYEVNPSTNGLDVHYPWTQLVGNIYQNMVDSVVEVIHFGAVESSDFAVDDWDELSATMAWGAGLRAPLVRGMPYVTLQYNGSTPSISSPQNTINITADYQSVQCTGEVIQFSRLQVSFVQSDATWVVYTGQPLSFTCQSTAAMFTLTAQGALTGALRLALVNNCTTGTNAHFCPEGSTAGRDASAYSALLDQHSGVFPVSGAVSFASSSSSIDFTFAFGTADLVAGSQATLLMACLPHMYGLLPQSLYVPGDAQGWHRSVRGSAKVVVGQKWTFSEPQPSVGFAAPRAIPSWAVESIKTALLNGSDADVNFKPPANYQIGAGDTYFSGKLMARLARVALVAQELGLKEQAMAVVKRLEGYLSVWLNASASANPFLYDSVWGGVVACGCIYDNCKGTCQPHCDNAGPSAGPGGCPALSNGGLNFGNGYYNDHHFHYGYWIYAAAVCAEFDPEWAKTTHDAVVLLIRDIANPSTADPYFPVFRHKDWYFGASWAEGIGLAGSGPYPNGRNQESTSEAVNAWYAVSLYGSAYARVNASLGNYIASLGNALLATELRSARAYWHVNDTLVDLYPGYAHQVVGILWSEMAQFQTWFGTEGWKVHGIQTLPFTPVTEQLLDANWVSRAYPEFNSMCTADANCKLSGWTSFLYLEHAVTDCSAAWKEVLAQPNSAFSGTGAGTDGNSRSNSLWWVATRPACAGGK